MVSKEDCLWFAGFYEAEGCCSCRRITLTQNDKTPLEQAQRFWGGSIIRTEKKSPMSDKQCTYHTLEMQRRESELFVEDIMPYLRVSRKINQLIQNFDINLAKILDEIPREDLVVYLTGFYEGDGCISTNSQNKNSLVINVAQKTIEPLDIFREIWGGNIYKRESTSPHSGIPWKSCSWCVYKRSAESFVKEIWPYMRIPYKIQQIVNAYEKKGNSYRIFPCRICGKIFHDGEGRRIHERDFHGDGHRCQMCNKHYKYLSSLRGHYKQKHPDYQVQKPEKPKKKLKECIDEHICSVCQEKFEDKYSLREHTKEKHSRLVCDTCGKKFKSKLGLSQHKQNQHSDQVQKVFCNLCGKTYKNKQSLDAHISRTHKLQRVTCNMCNKDFADKYNLIRHKRTCHTYDPQICDVCGETCKNEESYKKHYRVNHR